MLAVIQYISNINPAWPLNTWKHTHKYHKYIPTVVRISVIFNKSCRKRMVTSLRGILAQNETIVPLNVEFI